jgi:hypothetical protein
MRVVLAIDSVPLLCFCVSDEFVFMNSALRLKVEAMLAARAAAASATPWGIVRYFDRNIDTRIGPNACSLEASMRVIQRHSFRVFTPMQVGSVNIVQTMKVRRIQSVQWGNGMTSSIAYHKPCHPSE